MNCNYSIDSIKKLIKKAETNLDFYEVGDLVNKLSNQDADNILPVQDLKYNKNKNLKISNFFCISGNKEPDKNKIMNDKNSRNNNIDINDETKLKYNEENSKANPKISSKSIIFSKIESKGKEEDIDKPIKKANPELKINEIEKIQANKNKISLDRKLHNKDVEYDDNDSSTRVTSSNKKLGKVKASPFKIDNTRNKSWKNKLGGKDSKNDKKPTYQVALFDNLFAKACEQMKKPR